MNKVMIALTAGLLLGSANASAAFYGFFPGLPKLIGASDAIVVATIESLPTKGDEGGFADYEIRIESSLKGALGPQSLTMRLRCLPYQGVGKRAAFEGPYFRPGDRYILFLKKADGSDSYSNVNSSGATMQISLKTKLPAPDMAPEKAIAFLLKDYAAREKERVKLMNAAVESYLKHE
jgi:hypothetical protein